MVSSLMDRVHRWAVPSASSRSLSWQQQALCRSLVSVPRKAWRKGCRWHRGLLQPVCQLWRAWSCQMAISSHETEVPALLGSGTVVGAAALLPWLMLPCPLLPVSPPAPWTGHYKLRFPKCPVSCTLSVGACCCTDGCPSLHLTSK